MANYYHGYWYGGWGVAGFLWTILWWAIIIFGVILLVRWLGCGRGGGRCDDGRAPLDILKERYAKGEIDKREFEEKKKDLEA